MFCERPRANAVRPYRVLVKDFAISPLILHALTHGVIFLTVKDHLDLSISSFIAFTAVRIAVEVSCDSTRGLSIPSFMRS